MEQTWKRKFFTIAAGQAVSLIGSSAVQFALIWWIASETGSAVMMGLSGLAAFLPAALLSPVAGIVADRCHRKYVCIIADLSIGVTSAVFAALLWVFPMPVWSALLILLLRGIGGTFHQPALQAMIPQFVPARELVKVGGWNQMLASGSFLLGPAIGAAMYAAFSLPVILLTDLAGAAAACLMLAIVQIDRVAAGASGKKPPVKQLREGMEVFREDKALGLLIAVQVVCMVFYMPLSSFYPLMTSSYFCATAWHGSAVEVLYAAGMMLSAVLFGSAVKVKRHLLVSYWGLLGIGFVSALCGMLPPTMWAWVAFAAMCSALGAFGNICSIPLVAYMQGTIPAEKMGRAFSLITLTSSLAMPVGLVIASPIAEGVGVNGWFLISGIGITVLTLLGLFLHRRVVKAQGSKAGKTG